VIIRRLVRILKCGNALWQRGLCKNRAGCRACRHRGPGACLPACARTPQTGTTLTAPRQARPVEPNHYDALVEFVSASTMRLAKAQVNQECCGARLGDEERRRFDSGSGRRATGTDTMDHQLTRAGCRLQDLACRGYSSVVESCSPGSAPRSPGSVVGRTADPWRT
jgi:hypothetical protein